ncbi:hypothetical protein [Psychrobacter sp. ANT_WB68]|uniref:hypothetical protein n=1 Tax=Psychrobacter sp. ANT_WB68 TaxID=2597355 RepID=UPI0011F1714C|nr:hypothetical protein [Psychrobacter sp. ANT_WB68]KAA0913170.1 hypothetical protein FQ084_11835 [Psychrobacter sp. ANT_WB68]
MNLKLLALAGIMTATMGLTACDSNKENAAEDLSDAQEEVTDAQENLDQAAVEGEAVPAETVEAVDAAEAEIADAQVGTATNEIDAEVPVDGTTTSVDVASETPAVDAADEVVVEKPAQ